MRRLVLLAAVALFPAARLHGAEEAPEAVAWAQRARGFAEKIEDAGRRGQAFYRVTYCFARAAEFPSALDCAEQVRDPQKRVYAFAFTARQAAKHKQLATVETAIDRARSAAQSGDNLFAPSHVIQLLLELERIDEALDFALSLRREINRHYRLNDVAVYLASHGEVDRALKIVEQRVSASRRSSSYSQVASACAQAGLLARAETLLARISDPRLRDNPIKSIAHAKMKNKQFPEARAWAARVGDVHKRGELMAAIASEETKALDDDQLRQRFEKEQSRDAKVKLAETITKRLIANKQLDAAGDWIGKAVEVIESQPREPQVTKFGRRGDAILIAQLKAMQLDIAAAHHAGENVGEAVKHIEIARRSIEGLDDSSGLHKAFLQAKLTATISSLKLTDRFKSVPAPKPLEFLKPMAVAQHSAAVARTGKIEQALKLAEELKPEQGTGVVVGDLVMALVEQDAVDQAVNLLKRLDASVDIGHAYEAFGKAALAGQKQELDAILTKVSSPEAQAHICVGVSESILLAK